jgi:single-stranded DNA-binding protein
LNSIVLYATATTDPELRHTPDTQNRIASFLIQFPAPKQEDPPLRLKVTAWNNLADKAMLEIARDSQVIIEGRLRIDNVDRGTHKEKRTELVAEKIHAIAATTPQPVPTNYAQSVPVAPIAPQVIQQQTEDYDDIPY